MRCSGTRSSSSASMCVSGFASRNPGVVSMVARVPVLITTRLPRSTRTPPPPDLTSIVFGPIKRPEPITNSAPLFVGVAQYLNYSEASRRLHVAQPAISLTILGLEDELSVKLLLRTKRTVQLTAAGTAFLREAQEILRRANEAQHLAQRAARGEVGTLGIGFFGAASAPILPALVQAWPL